MWRRLKGLWNGREVALDEGDASDHVETGSGAEQPAAGTEPEFDPGGAIIATKAHARDDTVGRLLSSIDRSLAADDAAAALPVMRSALLTAATDPRILGRAAGVLTALGEMALADVFRAAANSRDAEPLVELSTAFVEMDDPAIAESLARVALARSAGDPDAIRVLSEALASGGDHSAAFEAIAPLAQTSDDPAILQCCARSAIVIGQWDVYDALADAMGADLDADALRRIAARARDFPINPNDPASATPRDRAFLNHGTLLLEPEPLAGRVSSQLLSRWISSIAVLLGDGLSDDTRIAYVTPRGEVLARWLSEAIGVAAMPLNARLQEQPLLVLLADDGDVPVLLEQVAYASSACLLIQIVVDPALESPCIPDVIGAIVDGPTLPLEELEGERARDRLPPKLVAAALIERAGAPSALAIRELSEWVSPRLTYLSLYDPPDAETRMGLLEL